MKLRWIDSNGMSVRDLAELSALRKRSDGFAWLDIPEWSEEAEAILSNEFHFHLLAIAESKSRSHVPRVHVYPRHAFIVVHAPEIGAAGHVHYLELDQFIAEDFLVTVHGPISPKVSLEAALRETEAIAARMESGRLHPSSPFDADATRSFPRSHAGKLEMVAEIAREVGLMEQRVMADVNEDPQKFLSELFAARHELLTIKTMAEQGRRDLSAGDQADHVCIARGAGADEGCARPVRDGRPHQRVPDAVSAGCHRVLSCAYRHQDDHCRRAARRDRGYHARRSRRCRRCLA